jgi:acetate kinase
MKKSRSEEPVHALALNSGSSSLKFGLYAVQGGRAERLLDGVAVDFGSGTTFRAVGRSGEALCSETSPLPTPEAVVERVARLLVDSRLPAPRAIGHRVVHGGTAPGPHCPIDAEVLRRVEAAGSFAPLHTPAALAVIRSACAHFPEALQVACFDTAFHAGLPDVARTLPLPAELRTQGLRRYGFHGLSCESVLRQFAASVPRRLLIAHLGNGASVTAVKNGQSIDTSMGLTPSGGLIMGTRSGDLDPGVLVYLAREKHFGPERLEELIDRRSGLAGISGLDGDMRTLHAASGTNDDAALAIRMFCYAVRKQLAAMWAVLDGVDAIVFTGGIGEHDAAVRAEICAGLSSLGIRLDEARHHRLANPFEHADSSCQLYVLPSLEDEQIALHAGALARSI